MTTPLYMTWEPDERPKHCSNCRNAQIERGTSAAKPAARCVQGHGNGRKLLVWQLIRPNNPTCWRKADDCPDFVSMSEEVS